MPHDPPCRVQRQRYTTKHSARTIAKPFGDHEYTGGYTQMWEEWYNSDWEEVNRGAMGNVRRLEGKESGHTHGRPHHVEVSIEA